MRTFGPRDFQTGVDCGCFLDSEDVYLSENISSCLPQSRNGGGGPHKNYGRLVDRWQRLRIDMKRNGVLD